MNLTKSHGNIIERVIRDKDGKLICARFFVYENNGRIKARLLDFVYLAEQVLLSGVNFVLSGFSKTRPSPTSEVGEKLIPNYYQLTTVYKLGSKPRAPTF